MKRNKNFWTDLAANSKQKPILVLAPMSGYTESPFRRLVKEIEPSTVLISELISSQALIRKNEKTMQLASFTPEEKNHYCVQIFGKDPDVMVEAGKIVEQMGADGIDLNFGCPSPKVIGSGYGSALLKDSCASARMIEKLVKSVSIPVSVKMRLGFYDDSNFFENCKAFEGAGIASIAIHGRTMKQKYMGNADWTKIYELKQHMSIPVLGNGDVTSAKIAQNKLKNLDGMMIGRGALRNPWIFAQARDLFDGKAPRPKPKLPEQLDFFRRHATMATDFKNEKWAMIELRKHFAHFVRGVRYASSFRDKLIRVESRAELETIFAEIEQVYHESKGIAGR